MDIRMGRFDVDKERGYLILEEGDGKKDYFTIEEELVVDEKKYFILVRVEGDQDEGGVLRVDLDGEGQEIWVVVDDEEELAKVEKALN